MELLHHPSEFHGTGSVVTVGLFDGVHRGHQELFRILKEKATGYGVPSVVYTFTPHPYYVMRHRTDRFILTPDARKIWLLNEIGIDVLVMQEFTPQFADTEAEEFVNTVLMRSFKPKTIVTGFSHGFGRGGKGTPEFLEEAGKNAGFETVVVPAVREGKHKINSTAVRAAVKDGDMELARAMLGRQYVLEGTVVPGEQRGRQLGMPTANVLPRSERQLVPAGGVYAGYARICGDRYRSLVYCGTKPTFHKHGSLTVEAHLLSDSHPDVYDAEISLSFIRRIREDRRFDSPEELAGQMQRDKDEALRCFREDT